MTSPSTLPHLNAHDMHSIIQSGLIPRRTKQQEELTHRVLHSCEPDWHSTSSMRSWNDLDKPRIAPYKHIWRSHHNTVFWCNLQLAQRKGLRFYQTRSLAITFSVTLPAICIDKVICVKTREELHCRMYWSPRLPHVTLVPRLQHVQKDVHVSESRKSDDREKDLHKGTCGSEYCVDFRIPDIPHSAVEQVERSRKEKVRQLIEQFENHPNRNMLLKDFEKSEKINLFTRESKGLITEMCNNEILEFYQTSSKRQCSDCPLSSEIGIVHRTCGKIL